MCLTVTWWVPAVNDVPFLSPPCNSIGATFVDMDVCSALAANARHLVVVVEPFAQVPSLTRIDGRPPPRLRLFRENVVTRHLFERVADGVNIVEIRSA